MDKKATCVLPQPGMTQEYNWIGTAEGIVWLGDDIHPDHEASSSKNIMYFNIKIIFFINIFVLLHTYSIIPGYVTVDFH